MALQFRTANPADYEELEALIIDSFEPITWMKNADERFGPLNGKTWRDRWRDRCADVFQHQTVLVGEADGALAAVATGTVDQRTKLGFIELLAVDRRCQGKGYGREMLRGMLEYMKAQGAVHASLECLTDNEAGNSLYASEGFVEVARSIRWFVKIP